MVTHHGKPMFTKVLQHYCLWAHLLTEYNYMSSYGDLVFTTTNGN
jgi:hypothetical protein